MERWRDRERERDEMLRVPFADRFCTGSIQGFTETTWEKELVLGMIMSSLERERHVDGYLPASCTSNFDGRDALWRGGEGRGGTKEGCGCRLFTAITGHAAELTRQET